jgi:phage shock protein E
MTKTRPLLTVLLTALLLAAGCSSGDTATSDAGTESSDSSSDAEAAGIRLVSATEGAALQTDPPDDLVILDVRTPEEFAEGHLDGAVMIDFYEADFADRLGELDPEVPYLLYCRSGNRSGQTTAIMGDLGFTDVADVDGGIVAWSGAGLPVVNG